MVGNVEVHNFFVFQPVTVPKWLGLEIFLLDEIEVNLVKSSKNKFKSNIFELVGLYIFRQKLNILVEISSQKSFIKKYNFDYSSFFF